MYECSVFGPGTTHWEGSVFHSDCGNSIILRHSQFSTQGARASCNNDEIVGHSVGVVDQCFTSQLNVTIESSLDSATVSCIHVRDGQRHNIGDSTIFIITGTAVATKNYKLMKQYNISYLKDFDTV